MLTSAHFGLLVGLALLAITPAWTLAQHLRTVADNKHVGRAPRVDLLGLQGSVTRAALLLAALVGLAIFSFTQSAGQLTDWWGFPVLVIGGVSMLGLTSVVRDLLKREVSPYLRGFDLHFERARQPVRYWISLGWNLALSLGLCAIAFLIIRNEVYPADDVTCIERSAPPDQAMEACSRALNERGHDPSTRAALLIGRGLAVVEGGAEQAGKSDFQAAAAILREVIRTGSKEKSDFYNLGLAYSELGQPREALGPFSEAILRAPDDAESHVARGNVLLDLHRDPEAWQSYDKALQINPDEAGARVNRGLASAWMNRPDAARADFALIAAGSPDEVVVHRGEAILAVHAKRWNEALRHLERAERIVPGDRWSAWMRAEVARKSGQPPPDGTTKPQGDLASAPTARTQP